MSNAIVDAAPQTFLEKVKGNWILISAFVVVSAWVIGQVIIVTNAVTIVQYEIKDNKKHISEIKLDTKEHVTSDTGHSKLSERMIKVETEVKHINTMQTTNFKDIKDQLKIIQQDVKVVRGR